MAVFAVVFVLAPKSVSQPGVPSPLFRLSSPPALVTALLELLWVLLVPLVPALAVAFTSRSAFTPQTSCRMHAASTGCKRSCSCSSVLREFFRRLLHGFFAGIFGLSHFSRRRPCIA
jgi:hypothetical protein